MSSHKEAPGISNDAAADNTDVYAFVSPDRPHTVTLIANFVPLQDPAGGPNFYEFGDDVRYEIRIDNDGDARPDVTYRFEFDTRYRNPDTFLYNTGPITSLDSPNWNRRQFAKVTRIAGGQTSVLATDLACPPCNIGPNSTPDYASLAASAVHRVGDAKVFTGQRAEGFYVDLGAIFDLGILRPFLEAHLAHLPAAPGINATKAKNIHTIALQVPIKDLTADGRRPTNVKADTAVLGVYAEASRQRAKIYHRDGTTTTAGPWQQVSRQGHPLINEVLIPIPRKDRWNSQEPHDDAQFAGHYQHPELSDLLNVLYPGVFANLAKYEEAARRHRRDPVDGHPGERVAERADLLRARAGRPVAAQRRGAAEDRLAEQPRRARW